MKVELSGKEMLATVVTRMTHLLDCREFIAEFRKHKMPEYLFTKQAASKYEHERTAFKRSLELYDEELKKHAIEAEAFPRGPVAAFLEEVEELERAERLIDTIASAMHYDSKMPDTLKRWLDRLTEFDDSE